MNVPSSTPRDTDGRPDDQLQQLEPDDFVDQGRAAAADEQQQHGGQILAGRVVLDGVPVVHKSENLIAKPPDDPERGDRNGYRTRKITSDLVLAPSARSAAMLSRYCPRSSLSSGSGTSNGALRVAPKAAGSIVLGGLEHFGVGRVEHLHRHLHRGDLGRAALQRLEGTPSPQCLARSPAPLSGRREQGRPARSVRPSATFWPMSALRQGQAPA